VYYVDIRLGKFIDYFSSGRDKADEILTTLREAIRQVKFYPLPPLTRMQDAQEEERRKGLTWKDNDTPVPYQETPGFANQGYFFQYLTDKSTGTMSYSIAAPGSHKAWESVVEVLSAAPSMHRSIFYLVEGFYALRKKHFDLFGEYEEHLISPKDNGWDTRYPLKMGKSVVLKLLFYRSSKATALPPCSLEIKTDGDAFAGFSQKEIPVLSRYNEERVLIACKRVFDSIFAPIIIELKQEVALEGNVSESASLLRSTQVATPWGLLEFRMKENAPQPQNPEAVGQELLAPNPFLLTQVVASKGLIFGTLALLVLASFFLFASPEYIQMVGWSRVAQAGYKPFGDWLVRNAPTLTQASKIFGAVFTLAAGYLAFRKLPVGK